MPKDDVELIAARAAAAARPFAATEPRDRSRALVAVADALTAADDELIELAATETGLGLPRLTGELKRTTVQLKLFAAVVLDGAYIDVRIDPADPDFVLGPRPDIRRTLVPRGPVLNYAGGNFPFAFSVAGGDTAAALAAGCPVILKAHPGHPKLSERTGELVASALAASGMPDHVFQLVFDESAAVALLTDDRIRAASFTGSLRAGRYLADIAAARPRPIPFYGELGSVNPVFVLPSAAPDAAAIGAGFVASFAGSAGQLCTKPGFLFVPTALAEAVLGAATTAIESIAEQRLLTARIAEGYAARRETVLSAGGAHATALGSVRLDDNGESWATPTLVRTTVAGLRSAGTDLLDEAFGPLSVVVGYDESDNLAALAVEFFPGNLAATLYAAPDDDSEALSELVNVLSETSGRVLFGGWPTGVAVTPAMQHGGPWPATTGDAGTSVGTAAIGRFLRGVSYQSAPQSLLPPQLRDANPWHVPQSVLAIGNSASLA
ncbi:MAG TPA: aldehyde dehydrogenase (NADP(+)) [Galbitalea sp.]|jgi:NADP-dependent aldehyde dehydrogenase|nr:aldehyde dehydrogenase (NADP(+)) [Galbitalea sp.]